ncbi:LysR substrate-binding domain-containing protein, partial [Pseudomonas aeruginosa]|uniref:LysR substrate-binding domain-containing protein n=1 Tax=Pseudomonas aeruginosa TaxID=287 RepID=UPI002B26D9AE
TGRRLFILGNSFSKPIPLNPFPFLYIPQFSRFTLLVYLTLSHRGCTYRQLAEDSLGTPLTVQEVGSYHAILACVAAGACVGVLPRSVLQLLGTPPLRSLPLAEVDTWLVWREGYATAAFERWRGVLGQAGD